MSSFASSNQPSGETANNLFQELLRIKAFEGLPEADLRWVASQMTVTAYNAGDVLFHEGEPLTQLMVALSGEFVARPEKGPDDGRRYFIHAGDVTGMLPYSRMKKTGSVARAVLPARMAALPGSLFPEMQQRVPDFYARLVHIMTDRARETTRDLQLLEKMAALGKLSAGLAHELNNPAAAARRAAESLGDILRTLRDAQLRLDERELTTLQRVFLTNLEKSWNTDHPPIPTNSLERADREDEISSWLDDRDVPRYWDLAAGLADAGCDLQTLNELARRFDPSTSIDVLEHLNASLAIARLSGEVQSSVSRISELVRAIKDYSYMDQMPQQEVDLHEGIENTLIMLAGRLKGGVVIARDYDRSVPKVPAYGSELNQVWTNLIDNASDAVGERGEIRIRTAGEVNRVLVEIGDNGPGVPDNIKSRIFEPFFTTKAVGQGTGLGLDIVYRIVRKHGGEVLFESKPGDTRFQVRLPFADSSKEEKT